VRAARFACCRSDGVVEGAGSVEPSGAGAKYMRPAAAGRIGLREGGGGLLERLFRLAQRRERQLIVDDGAFEALREPNWRRDDERCPLPFD
jgi:hypothetical protein